MRKLAWMGVLVSASASAAPKPPACVPGDTSAMTLFGGGGKAVACWEATGDCMSLDDGKVVSRPAAPKPAAEVRDDSGKPSACADKTCKPLGNKLADAVVKARGRSKPVITVTTDLAVVAIDVSSSGDAPAIVELWNVANDKKLELKKPAVFGKSDTPKLVRVQTAGKLALASWGDCEGPCSTKEIAVEPDGTNHSKAFDGGDTFALDNGFYVVGSVSGALTTLDHTGRHSGSVSPGFSQGMDGSWPDIVVVGADEVVVINAYMPDDSGRKFVHVKVSASGKPTIASKGTVPACGGAP